MAAGADVTPATSTGTSSSTTNVLYTYISLHKSLRILFLHKRRYILHEIEKIYIHTHTYSLSPVYYLILNILKYFPYMRNFTVKSFLYYNSYIEF